MEMSVYIVNIGKCHEGEEVGAWFTPPLNYEDIAEKIGLNEEYQAYVIRDYDLPFRIEKHTGIDEINHLCSLVEELRDQDWYDAIPELLTCGHFRDLHDLIESPNDIVHWKSCESMSDIARKYVEQKYFGEVPAQIEKYINYMAIGHDLTIKRTFIDTSRGIFEIDW